METRKQHGFTIVEIFVVIAVIGILAAIAIPVYANYSDRARMSEALIWLGKCKIEVAEVIVNSNGDTIIDNLNETCNEVGTDPSAVVHSTSVDAATGTIMITVDHTDFATLSATRNQFWMQPMLNGAPLDTLTDAGEAVTSWQCGPSPDGNSPLPLSILPNSCHAIL